jgi:hypothetical protein
LRDGDPLAFLKNPTIERIAPAWMSCKSQYLVPYTVTLPSNREIDFLALIDVPVDWQFTFGFFVRGKSPFDITQVGVACIYQRAGVKLFSLSAYGYRGLDQPGWAGMRKQWVFLEIICCPSNGIWRLCQLMMEERRLYDVQCQMSMILCNTPSLPG